MIAGTQAEYQSDAGSTKDTPYLALTAELWGAFCEYFWENWPCYYGTALHIASTYGIVVFDDELLKTHQFVWRITNLLSYHPPSVGSAKRLRIFSTCSGDLAFFTALGSSLLMGPLFLTTCRAFNWDTKRNKLADILQAFSNAFSQMKIFELQMKFYWNMFCRVTLTKGQHWFR